MARAIRILFGTETGNAEECAIKLHKTLQVMGIEVEILDMDDYVAEEIVNEELVFVVTSTFGNGEPPYNARPFMEHVKGLEAGSLASLRYSVCGLGDSSYPNFAKCGKDFDARLHAAGGQQVVPRRDCDVAFDGPFAEWQGAVSRWVLANVDGAIAPAAGSGGSGGKKPGLLGSMKKWFGAK